MPYQLEFSLTTEGAWEPGLAEQRGMHAILLQALQAAEPQVSQAVHGAQIKPFTQALRREADGQLCWRVTLLDDALHWPLLTGLQAAQIDHVADHPLHLCPEPVTTVGQSYAALVKQAPLQRLVVTLATPTCFKQRYYYQPIPTPYLCYQSWWSRWVQFAPAAHQINVALLDIVQAHLVISSFRLRSRLIEDEQQKFAGAVGRLNLVPLRQAKVEESWWQQAAVWPPLPHFAEQGTKPRTD